MRSQALILWCVAGLSGCAHAPRTIAPQTACTGGVCYKFGELGPGWKLVRASAGEVSYFHDASGAVIQANATCGGAADISSLAVLTENLMIGYSERRIVTQTTLPLGGREALATTVTAKLDGVPLSADLVVLKRDNCIYDFAQVQPSRGTTTTSPSPADFRRFVDGFDATERP